MDGRTTAVALEAREAAWEIAPGRKPVVDRERILLLDDLKLDEEGDIAAFGDPHEHHAGREGDVRLLNGRQEPGLEISAGQVERWRIINAANTRYVRLSIGGRSFAVLGTDGGLLPRPLRVTEALIAPGERLDLAIGPFDEGESFELEAPAYDRGRGESARERFASIRVGASAESRAAIPDVLRKISPLVSEGAGPNRVVSMKALMHGGQHQRDEPVHVGAYRCGTSSTTTCGGRTASASPGSPTTGPVSGCTTATSSSTTQWGMMAHFDVVR